MIFFLPMAISYMHTKVKLLTETGRCSARKGVLRNFAFCEISKNIFFTGHLGETALYLSILI